MFTSFRLWCILQTGNTSFIIGIQYLISSIDFSLVSLSAGWHAASTTFVCERLTLNQAKYVLTLLHLPSYFQEARYLFASGHCGGDDTNYYCPKAWQPYRVSWKIC